LQDQGSFEAFDRNRDGVIDRDEFAASLLEGDTAQGERPVEAHSMASSRLVSPLRVESDNTGRGGIDESSPRQDAQLAAFLLSRISGEDTRRERGQFTPTSLREPVEADEDLQRVLRKLTVSSAVPAMAQQQSLIERDTPSPTPSEAQEGAREGAQEQATRQPTVFRNSKGHPLNEECLADAWDEDKYRGRATIELGQIQNQVVRVWLEAPLVQSQSDPGVSHKVSKTRKVVQWVQRQYGLRLLGLLCHTLHNAGLGHRLQRWLARSQTHRSVAAARAPGHRLAWRLLQQVNQSVRGKVVARCVDRWRHGAAANASLAKEWRLGLRIFMRVGTQLLRLQSHRGIALWSRRAQAEPLRVAKLALLRSQKALAVRHMQQTVNALVRGTARQGFNGWRQNHQLSLPALGYTRQGVRLLGTIMASWVGDALRLCVVQWRGETLMEKSRGFILDRMTNVMNMNMIITLCRFQSNGRVGLWLRDLVTEWRRGMRSAQHAGEKHRIGTYLICVALSQTAGFSMQRWLYAVRHSVFRSQFSAKMKLKGLNMVNRLFWSICRYRMRLFLREFSQTFVMVREYQLLRKQQKVVERVVLNAARKSLNFNPDATPRACFQIWESNMRESMNDAEDMARGKRILKRVFSDVTSGTVRGVFRQIVLGWKFTKEYRQLQAHGVLQVQAVNRVLTLFFAGTTRGAIMEMKRKIRIFLKNEHRNRYATGKIKAAMTGHFQLGMRQCLFKMRDNLELWYVAGEKQDMGFRILGRTLRVMMRGILRVGWFQMKENLKQHLWDTSRFTLGLQSLRKTMSELVAFSLRGAWCNLREGFRREQQEQFGFAVMDRVSEARDKDNALEFMKKGIRSVQLGGLIRATQGWSLNLQDYRKSAREREAAVRGMGRVVNALTQGSVVGCVFTMKFNLTIAQKRAERYQLALPKLGRFLSNALRSTKKRCVVNLCDGNKAYRRQKEKEKTGLRILRRAACSMRRGTLQGAVFTLRENNKAYRLRRAKQDASLGIMRMLMQGTVQGAFFSISKNTKAHKRMLAEQSAKHKKLAKVISMLTRSSKRGALSDVRMGNTEYRKAKARHEQALKIMSRTVLQLMKGTKRGALSAVRQGNKAYRHQRQRQDAALRIMSTILSIIMKGTKRSALFNIREGNKEYRERRHGQLLAYRLLIRGIKASTRAKKQRYFMRIKQAFRSFEKIQAAQQRALHIKSIVLSTITEGNKRSAVFSMRENQRADLLRHNHQERALRSLGRAMMVILRSTKRGAFLAMAKAYRQSVLGTNRISTASALAGRTLASWLKARKRAVWSRLVDAWKDAAGMAQSADHEMLARSRVANERQKSKEDRQAGALLVLHYAVRKLQEGWLRRYVGDMRRNGTIAIRLMHIKKRSQMQSVAKQKSARQMAAGFKLVSNLFQQRLYGPLNRHILNWRRNVQGTHRQETSSHQAFNLLRHVYYRKDMNAEMMQIRQLVWSWVRNVRRSRDEVFLRLIATNKLRAIHAETTRDVARCGIALWRLHSNGLDGVMDRMDSKTRKTGARAVRRIFQSWLKGSLRGYLFNWKQNGIFQDLDAKRERLGRLAETSRRKVRVSAVRLCLRSMDAWLAGTIRGVLFRLKRGLEEGKVESKAREMQGYGLRTMSRILSSWLCGTARGCLLSMRFACLEDTKTDAKRNIQRSSLGLLSRVVADWMRNTLRMRFMLWHLNMINDPHEDQMLSLRLLSRTVTQWLMHTARGCIKVWQDKMSNWFIKRQALRAISRILKVWIHLSVRGVWNRIKFSYKHFVREQSKLVQAIWEIKGSAMKLLIRTIKQWALGGMRLRVMRWHMNMQNVTVEDTVEHMKELYDAAKKETALKALSRIMAVWSRALLRGVIGSMKNASYWGKRDEEQSYIRHLHNEMSQDEVNHSCA